MRAKFKCETVTIGEWGNAPGVMPVETAKLKAVMGNTPEDKAFNEATPNGSLEIMITNKAAHGYFKAGQNYYLDFTVAE